MKNHVYSHKHIFYLILVTTIAVSIFPITSQSANGKTVYDANCKSCHEKGAGGAPALGDKQEWQSRLAKGIDSLVDIAINGVQGYGGSMPPRGGNSDLTDEEVKAAVNYMIEQVK